MNGDKQTSGFLNRLPYGTIFVTHGKNREYPRLADDSVWMTIGNGKAKLVSHAASETEDLDWFSADAPEGERMTDPPNITILGSGGTYI